jgi:hypothetical protein
MMGGFAIPFIVKALPFTPSAATLLLLYLCLSIGAGIIASKLVEHPFLRFRDKYFAKT